MQLTYLLINFFTVIICFMFSFHPRIKFYIHFGAFSMSSLLVATVFIIWDIWFTKMGIWWFNDDYIVGIKVFGLPIEELLFFICIPFSCVFTYFCLDKFFKLDWNPICESIFVIVSIVVYLGLGLYFYERIYTFTTFILLSITLFVLYFLLDEDWIGKASFVYIVLLPGFVLVNGILTGSGLENPIVNYNSGKFIGLRLLSIPIEDFFYGYSLILWNIYFFRKFKVKELEEAYS
ncbi:MAG: lycopene cyclase domain-containing protein [Chryseobacterium sp.]|nr:MAG: lycopene cyclase domain-containing protein [Chryseobacterium sp.]